MRLKLQIIFTTIVILVVMALGAIAITSREALHQERALTAAQALRIAGLEEQDRLNAMALEAASIALAKVREDNARMADLVHDWRQNNEATLGDTVPAALLDLADRLQREAEGRADPGAGAGGHPHNPD